MRTNISLAVRRLNLEFSSHSILEDLLMPVFHLFVHLFICSEHLYGPVIETGYVRVSAKPLLPAVGLSCL